MTFVDAATTRNEQRGEKRERKVIVMQKSQFSGRLGAMLRDYHNNRRYYSVGGSEPAGVKRRDDPVAVVETDWLGPDALLMGSGDHPGKMDEPTIV